MKFTHLHEKNCLLLALLVAMAAQLSAQSGVFVRPKVLLSGALQSNGLMRDDIRAKGLLPMTEPYSGLANFQHYGDGGGETITNGIVLAITGNNAIVDWVVVELRNNNAISTPVATHAALLQRDGDVVAMDGVSPVHFSTVTPWQYHVSIRHRNHLGVMSAGVIELTSNPVVVDFTNPTLELYGQNPCKVSGTTRSLWLGDSNRDKKVTYQGPNNDILSLFSIVLNDPDNVFHNANHIVYGYWLTDSNMDGAAIYSGPNNDRSTSFIQSGLNCSTINCIFAEQIP
jgi:hypothetical protein